MEYINTSAARSSVPDVYSQRPREIGETASSRPSSLGTAYCASVSASPSRHAAVIPSAGTSRRRRSPPVASSQCRFRSRLSDESRQEVQFSLNFVSIIANLWSVWISGGPFQEPPYPRFPRGFRG